MKMCGWQFNYDTCKTKMILLGSAFDRRLQPRHAAYSPGRRAAVGPAQANRWNMDETARLIELLHRLSEPQFWNERDQNLFGEQQCLRDIRYINGRLRRDHHYRYRVMLSAAELSTQESAAQQNADEYQAHVDRQFADFSAVRALITELFPELLGQLTIADRSKFEKIEPAIVMRKFSKVLGRVLELDREYYSDTRSPAEWRKAFGKISQNTLARWADNGKIRVKKLSARQWSIHRDDVARLTQQNSLRVNSPRTHCFSPFQCHRRWRDRF